MTDPTGPELLKQIQDSGRPRLPMYEFMAEHDPQGLAGFNQFLESAIYRNKALDEGTKELLLACICTAFNASPKAIGAHCRNALQKGIGSKALLQALQITACVAAMQSLSKGVTPLMESLSDDSLAA
jgi:alkylhydroperoxidase/carboxymuconolactone decarboxylase family protein YurZ